MLLHFDRIYVKMYVWGDTMNYEKAYIHLFRAITQSINEIEKSIIISNDTANAVDILKSAQQTTEDMYISG